MFNQNNPSDTNTTIDESNKKDNLKSLTPFEANNCNGLVHQNSNGSYTLSSYESTAPVVNLAFFEDLCILSEDEIDTKALATAAFSEEDPLEGCITFKAAELEDLIEVDAALLCELYQLCEEHSNFAPQKLLDMVRFLNQKGFIPEFVIQKLITATYREVEKILESNEPEHAFLKFLK